MKNSFYEQSFYHVEMLPNGLAMASGAVGGPCPFRRARSQSFCTFFISLKAKSKDLSGFANTPNPLIIVLAALFAIGVVVTRTFLYLD